MSRKYHKYVGVKSYTKDLPEQSEMFRPKRLFSKQKPDTIPSHLAGLDPANYKVRKSMKITDELILRGATNYDRQAGLPANRRNCCGWSAKQLKLLGIDYPPQKGWKRRVIGQEISDTDAVLFLSLRKGRQAEQQISLPPVTPSIPIPAHLAGLDPANYKLGPTIKAKNGPIPVHCCPEVPPWELCEHQI